MKKIILFVLLALASSFTFAQEENVKKARSKAKAITPDFVAAKTFIDAALQDESTKNLSETWYVKGFIEFRKYEIEDDKRLEVPPRKPDVIIQSEASYNAFIDWIVADSLDQVESVSNPKRKGKLAYRKDIADNITKMLPFIANYGLILYNNGDYAKSKIVFEQLSLMPQLEMFKNSEKIKATDALFLDATTNIQVAMKQLYLKQVAAKDTVAFLNTLNEATQKYPNNLFFLSNMIQYNISTNKEKEALENINKALIIDAKNPVLYYMRGFIYSLKPDKKKDASADFAKAMEIKPDFAEAVYAYGALIIEEGDAAYNRASVDIKNPKEAELEMKRAQELYRKGIPYLEKARELNIKSDLDELLKKLQATYYKLKMDDKVKEIRAARGL
ncbi:MAG: hypothetical protein JW922_05140 [Paludibacteraceae bacterium]|nr:hypothetical protein [Paludibacteraceae bacterium]